MQDLRDVVASYTSSLQTAEDFTETTSICNIASMKKLAARAGR
jgi:hypothetical protein